MMPVMVSRQVRNGQLRAIGVAPSASYHSRVGPGDEVIVQDVQEEPFRAERFEARVTGVVEHGHYRLVSYERMDGGGPGVARVFADGPPDWGVIEFRIIKRVHRPPSARRGRGGGMLSHAENPLVRLAKPEQCPTCGCICLWIPRMGWPCLECRIVNDDADLEGKT